MSDDEECDVGSDYEDSSNDDAESNMYDQMLAATPAARETSFQVLDPVAVLEAQRNSVSRVASVLAIDLFTAGFLLRRFKWNAERLIDRYSDSASSVLAQAGITIRAVSIPPPGTICAMCAGTCCEGNRAVGMACGHFFCKECWQSYLEDKVRNSAVSCIHTTCLQFGCKQVVHEDIFREVLAAEDFARYSRFLSRAFVDDNPLVKWCPGAGCDKAIRSQRTNRTNTKCSCGTIFCFSCLLEAHQPTECSDARKWMQKNADEGQTIEWAKCHDVKRCPKCHEYIEKNEGCIHMTHRPPGCGHEFCWLCLTDWATHGGYNCNRPRQQEADDTVKMAYNKYIHYFDRFQNHTRSMAMIHALRRKMLERVELRSHGDSMLRELNEYLITSADLIMECRQVLKWTYPFAYFCEDARRKHLFEFQQADLENTTERLHELVEKPDEERLLRQEVTNLAGACRQFLEHLLAEYGQF
eukprot:gnl/Spiro4/8242_TR4356_c0_g1_i1.p1 gnl/Spiro4/8242_TR4356_c0_g1~~gnl/Spiro4/8242_TR4356_c0_g1_i1.p1  ORF type:complete len:480 (-),score=184.53 gnl/Spiro4/8242_TR4356_c0_g1_i1:82-1488(-)